MVYSEQPRYLLLPSLLTGAANASSVYTKKTRIKYLRNKFDNLIDLLYLFEYKSSENHSKTAYTRGYVK